MSVISILSILPPSLHSFISSFIPSFSSFLHSVHLITQSFDRSFIQLFTYSIRPHAMPFPLHGEGFPEMRVTQSSRIRLVLETHGFGDPTFFKDIFSTLHLDPTYPAPNQPFPSGSLRARNPAASEKLAAMRDGPARGTEPNDQTCKIWL